MGLYALAILVHDLEGQLELIGRSKLERRGNLYGQGETIYMTAYVSLETRQLYACI